MLCDSLLSLLTQCVRSIQEQEVVYTGYDRYEQLVSVCVCVYASEREREGGRECVCEKEESRVRYTNSNMFFTIITVTNITHVTTVTPPHHTHPIGARTTATATSPIRTAQYHT